MIYFIWQWQKLLTAGHTKLDFMGITVIVVKHLNSYDKYVFLQGKNWTCPCESNT